MGAKYRCMKVEVVEEVLEIGVMEVGGVLLLKYGEFVSILY